LLDRGKILVNLLNEIGDRMPHLSIEYSSNIEAAVDLSAVCEALHGVLRASGLFELGALRVRAQPCPHYAIADGVTDNGFADMVLRIGAGRSLEEKQRVGAALMRVAEAQFAALLARPHFALSLEVQEISAPLSWKTNAIHPRLRTK
jgi:5-carboxymethyl-2-hydroxymuconate isomerase